MKKILKILVISVIPLLVFFITLYGIRTVLIYIIGSIYVFGGFALLFLLFYKAIKYPEN